MKPNHQAAEIFSTEVDGWCFGLSQYPGEIFDGLVFRVIVEMRPTFEQAIYNEVLIDIKDIVHRFRVASKFLVSEREIAQCILKQVPEPSTLAEGPQCAVAHLLDQICTHYGDLHHEAENYWARMRRERLKVAA